MEDTWPRRTSHHAPATSTLQLGGQAGLAADSPKRPLGGGRKETASSCSSCSRFTLPEGAAVPLSEVQTPRHRPVFWLTQGYTFRKRQSCLEPTVVSLQSQAWVHWQGHRCVHRAFLCLTHSSALSKEGSDSRRGRAGFTAGPRRPSSLYPQRPGTPTQPSRGQEDSHGDPFEHFPNFPREHVFLFKSESTTAHQKVCAAGGNTGGQPASSLARSAPAASGVSLAPDNEPCGPPEPPPDHSTCSGIRRPDW